MLRTPAAAATDASDETAVEEKSGDNTPEVIATMYDERVTVATKSFIIIVSVGVGLILVYFGNYAWLWFILKDKDVDCLLDCLST